MAFFSLLSVLAEFNHCQLTGQPFFPIFIIIYAEVH